MPSFPDLTDPLSSPGVQLRLAAERDIPEILIAHQDDPELYLAMGLRRPPSGAELGRRIEHGPSERRAGISLWLTILAPGGNRSDGRVSDDCSGQIDVHAVDWDHLRAELGIWVAPGRRGSGLGAQALRLAAQWLLTDCGLERVQLLTEPDNQAMRRAALAAGFADEGILRAYLREHGERVDATIMSMVAGDLEDS
jgi:RimJ/RimL family protein N-acetyltransferase